MIIIPHSKPTIGEREQKRVAKTLESSQIAQGEMVKEFEGQFARKIGVKYAAAVSSGTAAIHLALKALEIGPSDQVIIPSYVCTALLNAIHYTGASPILADIDPISDNIDPRDVKKRLTQTTKAMIIPHLFGMPADLEELLKLDIPVIEDCAQSVGSTYQHKPLGSFGLISIFSFYATKMMTTGEGGMVVTNDKKLMEEVKNIREYDNKDKYKIRYNYKMTDIQAAMGLAQLDQLDSFIRERKTIAETYHHGFKNLDLYLPKNLPEHIYYRFVIDLGFESSSLIQALFNKGIASAKPVYKPLHRYLNLMGFPNTENAWQNSISIPIYPSISDRDVKTIIHAFKESCKELKIGSST